MTAIDIEVEEVVQLKEKKERILAECEFDCFLAHSWGVDNTTHKEVVRIGENLEYAEQEVWVDATMMK